MRIYSRPTLTWEDLGFLREHTKLPIVLKGILHPDDARRAVDEGIDGVMGLQPRRPAGRRRASSTIAALPAIADAVGGRVPIVHGRGRPDAAPTPSRRSRSGRPPCGIGRLTATGSPSPARPACARSLENFQADFDLTMGLAGCASVAEIGPEALSPSA